MERWIRSSLTSSMVACEATYFVIDGEVSISDSARSSATTSAGEPGLEGTTLCSACRNSSSRDLRNARIDGSHSLSSATPLNPR